MTVANAVLGDATPLQVASETGLIISASLYSVNLCEMLNGRLVPMQHSTYQFLLETLHSGTSIRLSIIGIAQI